MTLQKLIGTSVSQVPTNGMLGTLAFINAANAAFPAPVSFALGSAASPSLYFTGDVNTGIFSPAADTFAVSTAGTERLRITSAGVLQIADAGNITVGTTTGTKIGTATTQKIGFYNATPVVQPAAVADATTAIDVITQLNALLAKLRTLGIIAT